MSGRSGGPSRTKTGDHHSRPHPTTASQFTRGVRAGVMPRGMPMEDRRNMQFRMGEASVPRHPAVLEERFLSQQERFQALLDDNQRLAAIHVELKREVAAAQKDVQSMAHHVGTLKAEKDAQLRALYDKSVKMEMDLCEVEAMKAELVQVHADIKQLAVEKQEIAGQVHMMSRDLTRMSADLQKVSELQADIENLTEEIVCGRETIEYERKVDAENYERWQVINEELVSMSQEIEELRAEISIAEKRARAIAAATAAVNIPGVDNNANHHNPNGPDALNTYPAGYEMNSVHAEVQYAGNAYPESYDMNPVQSGGEIFPLSMPATAWNMPNMQHAQGQRQTRP